MSGDPLSPGYRIWLLAASCTCALGARSLAGDVQVQVDGRAHAKGLILLRATIPVHGELGDLQLRYSRDGDEFEEAGIGLPRPWRYFSSASSNEEETTVLVPMVARFQIGEFRFDEPGTYYLRWSVGIKDVKGFNFDQVLEIQPPHAADLDFIEGLGEPALMRAMFGFDVFERQTGTAVEYYADPGVRALEVIGRLLYATRARDPLNVERPKGDAHQTADTLLKLAKGIPKSSYAPYAAYYAGCCYAATGLARNIEKIRSARIPGEPKDRVVEANQRAALVRKDPDCAKALDAFAFAARRADDYLKPLALYQQAFLQVFRGAFDEAERLMTQAEAVVPGTGTIESWIADVRSELEEMKKRHAERRESSDR